MSAGDGAGPEGITTYHGRPVLKQPVWSNEIPFYFYLGGVAGASGGMAYLSGLRGNEPLARRSWAVAIAALGVSPALLVSDLGRPTRFLNMLRMFKVTSPMSVGTWVLSGSGAATAVAAAHAWTGRLAGPARVARPAAALLGLPLATYTGALVANTAVPVWHEARGMLPLVFGSGAALGAGAAAVVVTPPAHAAPARRLAIGAAMLEGPLMEVMIRRLGAHGEPYKHGQAGLYANISRASIVTGTALLLRAGGRSRGAAAAGALLSAGALATRWSVFRAGFQSAADPKYVIGPQRAGIRRGERRGGSRRTSQVATPDASLGSPATLA
jgi:formate-dependent nitrite reductase membrane component NrfD